MINWQTVQTQFREHRCATWSDSTEVTNAIQFDFLERNSNLLFLSMRNGYSYNIGLNDSRIKNLVCTCCCKFFLAFLSWCNWLSVSLSLSLISLNSCSSAVLIGGAPGCTNTWPPSCSWLWESLLMGDDPPCRRLMWDCRKELFKNALAQNGHWNIKGYIDWLGFNIAFNSFHITTA